MTAPSRESAVVDLDRARDLRKLREILTDPTHPQHQLLVNLLETATALDPPPSWGA